jgi:signal transduction histidine kinase
VRVERPNADAPEEATLPGAVRDGVAEVRVGNALVVAWARLGLLLAALALLLYGALTQNHPDVGPAMLAVSALHLALACAVLLLLRRRWRPNRVAFAGAAIDVVMVFGWGIQATAPGVVNGPGDAAIPLLGAAMLIVVLFAAVALPAIQVAPLAAVAVILQLLIGARTGIPLADNALWATLSAVFTVVAIWTGVRIIRLAAGMAVEATTAELAERHARALEAANGEVAAQRDQLISAQNEAEALAQVIVHDLKNPLATLLQYVSLAEAEVKAAQGPEAVVEYLEHAVEEGRRLSKLIGDLLLVYRLEQGVMAPTRESVPVQLLLDAVVRRYRARAAERGVTLEVQAEDGLLALIDLDLVQRMLENLVANAFRHVARGDHVSLEARSADGKMLLAVRNSGAPVPEELRASLFRRFVTGGLREWHNAGLGLYLCRLVAEAHSGSIALVDRPGWNVSFEITIPGLARRDTPAAPTKAATG